MCVTVAEIKHVMCQRPALRISQKTIPDDAGIVKMTMTGSGDDAASGAVIRSRIRRRSGHGYGAGVSERVQVPRRMCGCTTGRPVGDNGRRAPSSAAGGQEPDATTPRVEESWAELLALLPARSLFVALALVQIGVELAATAWRDALTVREEH